MYVVMITVFTTAYCRTQVVNGFESLENAKAFLGEWTASFKATNVSSGIKYFGTIGAS